MIVFNKKMIFFDLTFFLLLVMVLPNAFGYELATHARITQQAYLKSKLAQDEALLRDFGLDTNIDFGRNYFDVSDAEINVRGASGFAIEEGRMPTLDSDKDENLRKSLTIQGWIMRGAIREDDCSNILVWLGKCSNPTDGPVNENRPLNHFFDPINNRPLTIGIGLGDTAVNWGLGTLDAFTLPIKDQRHINHFTMFDAREAQYRALTGHTKEGTKDIAPSGTDATEPQIRNAYWATMFRALGDKVNRNGDMSRV